MGIGVAAFGTPSRAQANHQLAHCATSDASVVGVKVYTQVDIEITDDGLSVEYFEQGEGEDPPPTLRLARWWVRCAVRDGIDELLLEAAPDHQWRVLRDTLKAAEEIDADIEIRLSPRPQTMYDPESWYSGDSTQPRTLTREVFMKRENKLKKMPWLLYKAIAK